MIGGVPLLPLCAFTETISDLYCTRILPILVPHHCLIWSIHMTFSHYSLHASISTFTRFHNIIICIMRVHSADYRLQQLIWLPFQTSSWTSFFLLLICQVVQVNRLRSNPVILSVPVFFFRLFMGSLRDFLLAAKRCEVYHPLADFKIAFKFYMKRAEI